MGSPSKKHQRMDTTNLTRIKERCIKLQNKVLTDENAHNVTENERIRISILLRTHPLTVTVLNALIQLFKNIERRM